MKTMKSLLALAIVLLAMQATAKGYFELRIYEMKGNRAVFDNYLSKALIPYLNKSGVKNVGVFTEIGKSDPAKVYVFIPYPSIEVYAKAIAEMPKDADFQKASEEYNKIPVDQPAYWRYESSFMIGFDGLPQVVVPAAGTKLFELRIYEGYSEDAVRRKIKMFNDGEFSIFERVKLNSVFFGENVSGKLMPCLTYMTGFKNMEERDLAWKAFSADPEWQRISKLPEYANTVSRITKIFLEPASYSQL